MVLAIRQELADISALDGIVAMMVHQVISPVDMALIVGDRSRGLMVHHQPYPLGMSILIKPLDVEVGVWGHEVKHIILLFAKPIFPTDIPSLDQKLVHPILRCEIDVAAHIFIVGAMTAMGHSLGIVESREVEILGVAV